MQANKYYICVTPFFPMPDNWRGAYVLDQVKAIQRHSTLTVLVFMPSKHEGEYEIENIKVYLFKTRQFPSYFFNGLFNKYNAAKFIERVKSVDVNIDDIKFVHCHSGQNGCYGLAIRKINPRVRVLLQHHNLDICTVMNGRYAGWKLNNHYRARKAIEIFNEVDVHICISKPVKDSLLQFPKAREEEVFEPYLKRMRQMGDLQSIKVKNIYILNNGVDTSLFFSHEKREKRNENESVFRIGCIGNFQQLKDHMTLIRAFEILVKDGFTDLRLSLLGTGPTRKSCENYIATHNLSGYVEWPNEVPHHMLPDYYRSLDLFVLPSVFEGFGCVYTEAAACGVPFMGVYAQGAAECICEDEKSKWLIRPFDCIGLADRIKEYYYNRYRQKLSKDYDIDIIIRQFLNYIETV